MCIRDSYDAAGQLVGFIVNGSTYYYVYNTQGDIIKILDGDMQEVVEYKYDTWGRVVGMEGSDYGKWVGSLNPFMYRGYYYDDETGMYYLKTRYYNPEWGRFLNADISLLSNLKNNIHNLYAYASNHPVVLTRCVSETDIVKVVEGEESAVIVYLNDNNGPGYYITKKSDDGWMLENSFDSFIHGFKSKSISAGNIFNCFSERAPGTNECFSFGSEGFMEEKVEYSESDVKDSQGSTFEQFPIHINNYTLVVHYAVVQSNDPDYEVIINGERVKIEI